jgi:hypothetical protein
MVTVSKDGTKHTHKCKVPPFISYSVSSFIREQAINVGWVRPKVGRVKWPGQPPMSDAKKVDLCPEHAKLVMTDDEVKAHKAKIKAEKKVARDEARAEKKAEKRRQRAEARDVAKAVKAKKARKKKGSDK